MERRGDSFQGYGPKKRHRIPREVGSFWKLCTWLRARTAATTSRHRLPPGPAPATPAAQPNPPAPGTAASITFMPRLPEHRPAGMEGGRAVGGWVPVSPGAGAPAPPARCKHTPAGGGRLGRGAAPWQPGRKRKRGGQGRHVGGGLGAGGDAEGGSEPAPHNGARAPRSPHRDTPPGNTLPETAGEVLHLYYMLAPSNFPCKLLGTQRREMN
ncbi:unnamed protein product [Coccothraustes coccothraustes]